MQFARRLGIAREHLSRIESGASLPGTDTLRRIAQALGVSLNFVLLGSDQAVGAGTTSSSGDWEAALAPLLAGTTLRLIGASAAARRKADRAWHALPEARREEIRNSVRGVALAAVAIERLLPPRSARAVTDLLSQELSTMLADRLHRSS